MKDIKELRGKYFDVSSQEIADHIEKWLATLNFVNSYPTTWNHVDKRLFFPHPIEHREYFFTSTEHDQSWEKLYEYGLPKFNQNSELENTLTEDDIRDFYFIVSSQDETDDALKLLEEQGEIIIQYGLGFTTDWNCVCYYNGQGWRLSDGKIGKRSTYQELVNLFKSNKDKSVPTLEGIDKFKGFYYKISSSEESINIEKALRKIGETVKNYSYTDNWCYLAFINDIWNINDNYTYGRIEGNKDELLKFLNIKTEILDDNITLSGSRDIDISKVNNIARECSKKFSVGDVFLDLVHNKESTITKLYYTYYPLKDRFYINVTNDKGDQTQCIYMQGKYAEKPKKVIGLLEEAKNRYPIGTKFIPAHIETTDYCIITTEYFKGSTESDTIYAKLLDGTIHDVHPYKYGNTPYSRVVYHKGKWAEIIVEEKELPPYLPNSAKSPKNITDLRYPDVVHIQTEEEYKKIQKFHNGINNWDSRYHYYLIGHGGYSEFRKSYQGGMYTIYEMNQIIMHSTEEVKNSNVEIFPGIKIGDIVVSTVNRSGYRKVGDMFKVLPNSSKGCLYYLNHTNSHESSTFRLATKEEVKLFEKGVRNINSTNIIEVGSYVTVISSVSSGNDAQKLIGKTFKVTVKRSATAFNSTFYVCGAKEQYPHLFSLPEGGIYEEDIRLATQDEINSLEYRPITNKENFNISTRTFSVGDYVKIVSVRNKNFSYAKIVGEVFQITEICFPHSTDDSYVKGYKESYPHLFNIDRGVYTSDIVLATKDEINQYNFEKAKRLYPPGTKVQWNLDNANSFEIVPNEPYKIYSNGEIGTSSMRYFLFDRKWTNIIESKEIPASLDIPCNLDLRHKSSKQIINTRVEDITPIHTKLKEKQKTIYF